MCPASTCAAHLPLIQRPTLVMCSGNAHRPIDTVAACQKQTPDSQLVATEGSGYHATATQADACAEATAAFIAAHAG